MPYAMHVRDIIGTPTMKCVPRGAPILGPFPFVGILVPWSIRGEITGRGGNARGMFITGMRDRPVNALALSSYPTRAGIEGQPQYLESRSDQR